MNKLVLIACCCSLVVIAPRARSQGTIVFNNLGNTDPSPSALTNGLVFLNANSSSILLNQDINFELFAGRTTVDMQRIHSWLLSDGSARGIATGSGHFSDPSGSVFSVPGVPPGGSALVTIIAWTGSYPDLLSAMDAGAPIGNILLHYTTGGGGAAPTGLVGMPALLLSVVPEPSSFAIGLGGCLVLALNRLGSRRGTEKGK